MFYGHSELGDELIKKIYDEVSHSNQLLGGAYDLALFKSQIELEKVYENYLSQNSFEWDDYLEILEVYGFNIESRFLSLQERGFNYRSEENLPQKFQDNYREVVEVLTTGFMAYMHKRGMRFPVTGTIWNHMYEYWEAHGNSNSIEKYFKIREPLFKEYLRKQSGMIMDYRFLGVLILYGSSYVYDFLKEIEVISEKEYEDQQEIIKNLKNLLINEDPGGLWKFSFVHQGTKQEAISEEDFAKEKEVFSAYYGKSQPIIGSGFFIETPEERDQRLKELFRPISSSGPKRQRTPKKRGPKKIGRNVKVTVKYKDGTIKKNVKYKTVSFDARTGKCELVEQ